MSLRLAKTKPVAYAPQVEAIPLLPGNNFHDDPVNRATLRKSHMLGRSTAEEDFVPPTEYSNTNNPFDLERQAGGYGATSAAYKPTASEIQEKWAAADKPFRFVAYFKEGVAESAEEETRIRKVCITFFANDKTLQIREAKVGNSGMCLSVHGGGSVLLRRQQVFDTDCQPLDLDDFQVGGQVEIYGRVYQIIDTDKRTRNELEMMGKAVGPPVPYPEEEDVHAKLNTRRMQQTGVRRLRTEDMDVKRIAEFALSGRYSKAHPEQTKALQQFLAADGSRKLSFSLLWEEPRHSGPSEVRVLTLRYHLEDDSVEIAEQKQVNCGREGGVKFLCRQRIPKDASEPCETQHNTYGRLLKSNYLTHKDLRIGEKYTVHGKELLLFDADEYTRQWYEKHEGVTLPPAIDVSAALNRTKQEPVKHYPPPHNGFGNENDSLSNWKNLILRPMRNDGRKLLDEGHIVYKFKAKMHNPVNEEDADREFVFNHYVATGENEIFELPVRNSGVVSGKYLGRTKLFKEDARTGQKVRLTKDDLYEGAVIPVLAKHFVLLHMDERSRKYRDNVSEEPSADYVRKLVVALQELVRQKYDRIGTAMKALSSNGRVGVADIERFFAQHNQPILKAEARTLVAYFDKSGRGSLGHDDFVALMQGTGSSLDAVGNRPQAVKVDAILDAPVDRDDPHDVEDRANSQKALYTRTLGILRDKLIQRRSRSHEVFRLMAGSQADSRMSVGEFTSGLVHILHLQLSDEEREILVRALFGTKDKVTYNEFSTFLEGVQSLF